jgi:aarF domain-containing kinase
MVPIGVIADVMKMQSKMKEDIKEIMVSDRGFPE